MDTGAGPGGQLTTGAFARTTGLSAKALRLYDSSGLLVPAQVDPHSGYRYYAPAQVDRARRIALLRQANMPLARIRVLLEASDAEAALLLGQWWAEQEDETSQRAGLVAYLRDALLERPGPTFPVQSRHAQERTLATVTARVTQHALVETIIGLRLRLREHLQHTGAIHGEEHWVLYHGVVTPDGDGPIEVCVPYEGTAAPSREVVLRVEPARQEAFVELTAAQCRYPPILHAYAAVEQWVGQHGQPDGPPREIYPVAWDDRPGAGTVAEIVRPYR
ncbi:helix-turn-helix domain-containing protein [Ornithinimicrobium faecis]|uniref:Helix-turn-helix domain-containing protein n=1 Tax=Ornithinimicrobium faecis TaxID=2934158 RepID=A0ABY4YXY5_9MICO|nr:helix-turn-helix domain-containing protein [Ornithinimicrobium sp. HY1793]USQ81110.1 helix-turn-helix domain-containing protein [Ornithinimicrobium sp. HY1793]